MKPKVGMEILVSGQFEAILQTKLTATNEDPKTDEWYAEIPRQRIIVRLMRGEEGEPLFREGEILALRIEQS